jgi:GT2 family glycosyltransferase
VAGYLSTLDRGPERHVVPEEVWLVGANIAFDRDALREIGGFPEHLGRQGGKLLSGEETAVKRALERRGLASWYAPDAVVRHYVSPERMTQRWLLRRIFWQGVTDAHHVRDRLALTAEERADIRRHWREAMKLWNWPKLLRDYPTKGPFLRRTVTARALGYVLARLKLVR